MKNEHRPYWLDRMPSNKERQAEARSRYTAHALKEAGPDRWYLSDGTSYLWAEIACLRGGRIVVIGDGPDLIVRCSDSSPNRLRWLARGGADYIASKCDNARTWDVEYALEKVWDVVSEWAGDPDYEDWTWERCGSLMGSLRYADEEGDFVERVMAGGIDEPWEYGFGRIVKNDVLMAIAAARRVVELLDKETGDE